MAKSKAKSKIQAKKKAPSKSSVKTKSSKPLKSLAKKSQPKKSKPQKTVSAKSKAKQSPKKNLKTSAASKKAGKLSPVKTVKTKPGNEKLKKSTSAASSSAISNKKQSSIDFSQFVSPLEDRVFVEVANHREKKTAGGLYIPDTVSMEESYIEGKVLSVGPGKKDKKGRLRPLDVRIGDRVLFLQYAGTKIELEQRDFYFLSEDQVLGVKK